MKARMDAIPSASVMRVHESLDLLIELYTSLDKPDEVDKYTEL